MEDNSKLKTEIRNLREQLVTTSDNNETSTNNVDVLKRLSQLEKAVFGNFK